MLEDVNDEIPLFTEREQETVLEGEPIGTKVTQVNAIDKDGTFPNNQVRNSSVSSFIIDLTHSQCKCLFGSCTENLSFYHVTCESLSFST
jgi:hypothetical protein